MRAHPQQSNVNPSAAPPLSPSPPPPNQQWKKQENAGCERTRMSCVRARTNHTTINEHKKRASVGDTAAEI